MLWLTAVVTALERQSTGVEFRMESEALNSIPSISKQNKATKTPYNLYIAIMGVKPL